MSRRPRIPSYCLHKQYGQAVVTLTDPSGRRRDVLLGKHGTAESRLKPVPLAWVEAVLPLLRPVVATMIRLQLHSGMRPGEVVRLRALGIDMTGTVWLYRPGSGVGPEGDHKTAHRGHSRVGPRCQAIIREYLKADLSAYLFSPAEAMAALRAEQRQKRKTKVQPSQQDRRKKRPKRKPGQRSTVGAYAYAIRRACIKAGVPHWHPHQLRHNAATEIRREAGLDAACAVLGHRTPTITEVYAEIDTAKAAAVMEKLG